MGLVVLFTQGLQIVLVSAVIGLFFLEEVLGELRQAFAVRAVYLATRAGDGG